MYGILKARKCQHNATQYQTFKAYYCGLCDSLGTHFGSLSRLSVNYDMTFFYLLLDSFNTHSKKSYGSCPTTPWKKREIIVSDNLHTFLGAVNLYLAGLKLQDDILDQGSFTKQIGYQTLRGKLTKAETILHDMGINIAQARSLFENQQIAEAEGHTLADYFQSTAEGLSFFLSEGARLLQLSSNITNLLTQIGYELGKVIYIMDSFVDYPSDTKNDKFNALAQAFGDQLQLKENIPTHIREEIYTVLNTSLINVKNLLLHAPVQQNQDLLNLIISDLQWKVETLVRNTQDMEQVEQIVKSASPFYLLKNPTYFLKSRAAHHDHHHHHHHHHSGPCCCDCEDMITTAICCDAADCDCDAIECLSTGNPCELLECFC